MKKLLYPLLILITALSYPALSQDAETQVQQLLEILDNGKSIENRVVNLSDINFESGTAQLEPIATSYLNQVVSLMQKAPNIDLFIQGHTDTTGSDELNDRLSQQRAESVQQFLLEQGIEPTRLSVQGFGSRQPVADNQTTEGRAQNRRVEMEVLKREEAETIQDIIVLRNRQRIGAVVIFYNDNLVRYQQFTKQDTLELDAQRVDSILFANGTVKAYSAPPPKEKFNLVEWWNEHVPIFQTSQSFHRGNFVLGVGIGTTSNIGIGYGNNQVDIPPVLVIIEQPIGYNLGVGITGGAMHWIPDDAPDVSYAYYAVSTRLAYHFNLGRKLDLYTGFAVNGRQITATHDQGTLKRQKIDTGFILGARYYFNNTLGLFGEIGDESVACPKLGLVIKFGN